MIIGIGDQMLHFGTQTWITATSPTHKRGRNIAFYGFFFSLGFAIGPIMTGFITVNQYLPFWLAASLSFIAWLCLLTVRNEFPEENLNDKTKSQGSLKRFYSAWKIAWVAFLPPFGYGFLESSLLGNFPVYALRIGLNVDHLALLLPLFAIGSLITQMPLGILKLGGQKLLIFILIGGLLIFSIASLVETHYIGLVVCLVIAGMLVGSTFSLGISFMADLLPKNLLPAGNILCGISFSVGSILGPFVGGFYIQWFPNGSFFYVLCTILIFILIPLALYKDKKNDFKGRTILRNSNRLIPYFIILSKIVKKRIDRFSLIVI